MDTIICYFLLVIMLSTRVYFHADVTIECLNFDLVSKNGIRDIDKKISVNIGAISLKIGMRFDFYLYH